MLQVKVVNVYEVCVLRDVESVYVDFFSQKMRIYFDLNFVEIKWFL
jgi:hypothetical protein